MSITKNKSLEQEFVTEKLPRKYTNSELEAFGRDIERFYEEKELPTLADKNVKEKVRILNIYEAAVWFGAMKKRTLPYLSYSVIMGGMPMKYDIFMDKLDQWYFLKGKRKYASDKALEDYAGMAEQALDSMRYTPDIPDHEE